MFICPNHNIVFVAVPKTATRSIYEILKTNFNGELYDHQDHMRVIPNEFKNYFSFTVVRNPYDRICSTYWHLCKKENKRSKMYDSFGYLREFEKGGQPNTLESYLHAIQIRPSLHSPQQYLWHNRNRIDQVLRFENLQEDFNTLPFIKESINLPYKNVTAVIKGVENSNPRPSWQEMIDSATGKMINSIYKEDVERFGYERIEF